MIKAEISNAEIAKLQLDMFMLRKKTGKDFRHRVTARFGKRGAGKILKDGVREKHTIKASKVHDYIAARQAGSKFFGGIIVNAKSRQKGIEHFKVSPRETSPARRIGDLKAKTEKQGQKIFRKVFTGNLPGPNKNVFYKRRTGTFNKNTKKEKLKYIVGPSLFAMYLRNRTAINQKFEDGFINEAIKSIESVKRRMAKR